MEKIIEIRLRDSGQTVYCQAPPSLEIREGDIVILEFDRGLDYGQIISDPQAILDVKIEGAPKKIVRVTSEHDLKQIEDNRKKANRCQGKGFYNKILEGQACFRGN